VVTDTPAPAELPTRSRLVHDSLRAAGIAGDIVVLPDAASTAPLAAAALGVEVGAIANSLVFWSDGEPLLVMTSGAHRVDTQALAARLGREKIQRATPEQVREATGQAIGGVAPTGHPTPLTTIVDEDLARFPEIWAAGGTPHTVFPMTYEELVRLTSGMVAKVD
jgi:prolyl-tRNA editing enzyme YbaK/EbsC (Cys-tRNA(Pro) deacylase)